MVRRSDAPTGPLSCKPICVPHVIDCDHGSQQSNAPEGSQNVNKDGLFGGRSP